MKKECNICHIEKDLNAFRKDKSRIDGYAYKCKQCARGYDKSAYMCKYGDSVRIRDKQTRKRNRLLLVEYKSTRKRLHCEESESICLDFHHVNPNDKLFGIGSGMMFSWNKIETEINKCVIVCANCHRKIHAGLLEP